jgi:hypothetical protein
MIKLLRCLSNNLGIVWIWLSSSYTMIRWNLQSLVKTTCAFKVALICSFCANDKDKRVVILKGALGIGYRVLYIMKSSMLKVELISKFSVNLMTSLFDSIICNTLNSLALLTWNLWLVFKGHCIGLICIMK